MNVNQILSFDLEITKDQKKLLHLGAVLGDEYLDIRHDYHLAIQKLNDLAVKAEFILGHNILNHDLPWLIHQEKLSAQQYSDTEESPDVLSAISTLPVIDTLFLSPLAFPKNPYHRLVKDYKIIKDSYNNPVADAHLALRIFSEQFAAFEQQYQNNPYLIQLYYYLFHQDVCNDRAKDFDTSGLAQVMADVIGEKPAKKIEILIADCLVDKCCPNQLRQLIRDFRDNKIQPLCLAYVTAWLQVAGSNSILPPWVWHQFPATKILIRQLRETPCGKESCTYCQENFDARYHLQNYYEWDDFRLQNDGTPLQKNMVDAAIRGESLLGILPTGGGKSLCFQLPALIKNKRNASLTIVISPLQALMKDQVDNLKDKVGIESVAAIYGMLTMPERSAVLEAVRRGDISILYLSPEQLRNRRVKQVILSRQIGAWVFDEAHCLSKWGHDFRPDYLYCAKVIANIAKQQNETVPPVLCYTATAKMDVIDDICGHFKQLLDFDLSRFEGGVQRENLVYEVVSTQAHSKLAQIIELTESCFNEGQSGSCVIYCATRKKVEQLAQDLNEVQELPVSYFHAGLDASSKRDILERFIAGEYRIICATNAFGMGIDKEDVRLVIHYDIPGSVENYLQEAGRAGRDQQPAQCVLLFDKEDIEQQFKLSKHSEIRLKDIAEILKEIRYRAKSTNDRVVATTKELLRSDFMHSDITVEDRMADTKVKTALAWLEREGFLQREDNINSVFQGKPLFANLMDAEKKLEQLQLSPSLKIQWQLILEALINADDDEGLNADDILDTVIANIKDQQQKNLMTPQRIMEILAQMACSGLISRGLSMTAWLRPKGCDNCRYIVQTMRTIENTLLDILPEMAPDSNDHEQLYQLDIRALNSRLIHEHELKSSTRIIRQLLKTWSDDGQLSGNNGSINFSLSGKEQFSVQLNRSWAGINKIVQQRQEMTDKIVDFLYAKLTQEQACSKEKIMIEFSLEDGIAALNDDLLLHGLLSNKSKVAQNDFLLKGIERALLFLDTHKAIDLQNGMAVFKQSMEIKLNTDNKRCYSKKNYHLLDDHYHQKIIQIHVMNEYARLGLEQIKLAMRLIKDYFELLNGPFVGLYFRHRKSILERATSQESWHKIVVSLNNQAQQAIVHASIKKNQLILAGPGAGKSKVILHRVAYLVRVKRVPANKILLLCFNHNTAISLHKRLLNLLGQDARFVRIHTFHGLALRLLGQMFEPENMTVQNGKIDFDVLIKEAIKLLTGESHELGLDALHQRAALLDGLEHILVDEYQDVDQLQYEMICALTGKQLEAEEKLSLMVVGDDDQSIYQFRQANIKFIHQFQQDYQAKIHYLTQNYRSTKNIIAAANSLITYNQDRMKNDHPIYINESRRMELPGGHWQKVEALHQGKVALVHCTSVDQQANEVLEQILTIKALDNTVKNADIAVLARHGIDKNELSRVRSVLHQAGIDYCYSAVKEDSFPLHAVKEFIEFKQWLSKEQNIMTSTSQLLNWLPIEKNHWHQLIETIIIDWQDQFDDTPLATTHFLKQLNDYLLEQKRQTRYGQGILLSTVHGVKGEEFRHVILLDGNWQFNSADKNYIEEERRLYYVAMTRAIEHLVLMQYTGTDNPHIACIDTEFCSSHFSRAGDQIKDMVSFYMSGLSQLYLSYAAKFQASHPVNQTLENLNVGDRMTLVANKSVSDDSQSKKRELFFQFNGINIIKLSKQGKDKMSALLSSNHQAKVIALVRRQSDPNNDYDANNKIAQWWVPVIELIVRHHHG